MRFSSARFFSAAALASLLAVGCGGGGAEIKQSNTTMGQELMDLEESYKKGIITEKEYNKAKEAVLDRYQ